VDADDIIRRLGLTPHPEGGHYRETFRDTVSVRGAAAGDRAASTAIYYLLQAGEVSGWHRVDAAEIWHWYRGAPLVLATARDGAGIAEHMLGPDLVGGQRPQVVVPAGVWQSARSLGGYTLVGCTVAPGFEFSGFELALPGFAPG
jgi:predicted cupin superfamily sugar epimerase